MKSLKLTGIRGVKPSATGKSVASLTGKTPPRNQGPELWARAPGSRNPAVGWQEPDRVPAFRTTPLQELGGVECGAINLSTNWHTSAQWSVLKAQWEIIFLASAWSLLLVFFGLQARQMESKREHSIKVGLERGTGSWSWRNQKPTTNFP